MPPPRDDQTLQITLLQERSTGTFARVYLAEARGGGGLSRVVAVKVIKEQWSDSHEILTRTRDEARLLARLQHKNILRVEALAEVDGQPAIVMEFVDGLDLQQLIEKLTASARRIPRRALYKIMADATGAIAAAWEEVPLGGGEPLRVVHRDLKPSNVMVSKQGEVKVLDFGTARFEVTDRQARTGALRFGSLKYMSPERRQGDRGEHGSDVYALGLLCIEMLRGEMLPILPLEPLEHDAWLADLVDRLGDLGLPDARWDDALRQTLRAMVHSDPAHRLHASQLVALFRAFADNATGASLDAFAAETVAELAGKVYGAHPGGSLAGSRVFVAMTTSSDLPVPPLSPRNLASGGYPTADPNPPQDPGWSDLDQPTQVSASPLLGVSETGVTQAGWTSPVPDAFTADLQEDEPPTMVNGATPPPPPARGGPLPVQAAPAPAPGSAHGAAPFPVADSVTRPSLGPAPAAASHTTAASTPAARKPAAAPAAPAGRSNLMAGLIAALVVFVLGGLLLAVLGAGVAGWYYWQHSAAPPLATAGERERVPDAALAAAAGEDPADPAPGDEAPADEAPGTQAPADQAPGAEPGPAGAAASDPVAVEVVADDEMIQWIAIEDAEGARRFKGSPGGTVQLPPGDYRLLAKVRARGTVQHALVVGAATRLDCMTAEKGAVRCTPDGAPAIELTP